MEIVLYERELDVMEVLWEQGNATVAEVRDALEDEMAYTTVLTVLRRLEDKGFVAHDEEGRAHRYRPLVARTQARESALERLTRRLFQGSPELLLTHLVSQRKLSDAELRRLRDLVEDQLPEEER
ncbi:MAG: BlaI/MecI/CopY family transcriptional regulator [Gemmatimonadetes bacterium]|nr:BlaI/MecI/CopY family transcriptional regulator [Gemmatimonadota bacterium]